MDSDSSHRYSNREYRLQADKREIFPDGVEDWLPRSRLPPDNSSLGIGNSSLSRRIPKKNSILRNDSVYRSFDPVSIILSTHDNILLSKDNGYEIKFNTGILEGKAVSIDAKGSMITFKSSGSYRFEMCGEAALFSDADVTLVYSSNRFPSDIKQFSIIAIPREDSQKIHIRGVPTILPIEKNQTIITKLIVSSDQTIVLMGGAKLLIHRVA